MNGHHLISNILNSLNRKRGLGHTSPHKVLLWLATLDLMDRGYILENRIYFDNELIQVFTSLFNRYKVGKDLNQPSQPFFHLRSSGIWKHKVKPGEESYYANLTTSGGGSLRIERSIEFAYLDDDIYEALTQPETRAELRHALITLLQDENRGVTVSKRIGTLFHESFALSRPGIAAALRQVNEASSNKELVERLQEEENLGRNWAKAVPAYARGCGFLDFGSTNLTPLGEHVLAHDPDLHLPETLWLMHYHLSAPHGPGPRFWHELVLRLPELGDGFGREAVVAHINATTQAEGAELKERGVASTATVFLGSYTKSDALGPLGILQESENGYTFDFPEPPSAGVVGYCLSHYWQGQLGVQQTCSLDTLSEPGNFASVMLLSSFDLNRALRQLAQRGVLELWMAAPPYQVSIPSKPEALLEGIYVAE